MKDKLWIADVKVTVVVAAGNKRGAQVMFPQAAINAIRQRRDVAKIQKMKQVKKLKDLRAGWDSAALPWGTSSKEMIWGYLE